MLYTKLKLLRGLLVLITISVASTTLFSQAPVITTEDTLNCEGGTPTFIADLSSDPDSIWVSTPIEKDGMCCGMDDNCIQFVVTLAPSTEAIIFNIPDTCGATPGGALNYQVDCGPLTSIGTPLCLSGTGPFILTFCKPGNNLNCFSIEAIAPPETSEDIIITDDCTDSLSVTGLTESTITWSSISPGLPGEYDSYLDCTSGCASVAVSPTVGSPSVIQYEVCGERISTCTPTTFCDTISVEVVPSLGVSISPINPTICFGSPGVELTANPIGGAAPYNFLWNTGSTDSVLFATSPGTYIVEMTDITNCAIAIDTVVVTEFLNPITANAGGDIVTCASPGLSINLDGAVTGTTTGVWSNGTGTFAADSTDLTATYTPSAAEISAGTAELILTTTGNGTCPADSDYVLLLFPNFNTTLDTVITDVDCFDNATGSIDLIVAGGALPLTYSWSTGATTEDIDALPSGSYTVIVADTNNCTDTLTAIINEPTLLNSLIESPTYPSGDNISCHGFSDGSIDLTVNGGTPGYTYAWSIDATTEDLSSLPAGAYSVTVTDVNGCITTEMITLTEPSELTLSLISPTYPSGDNISCNGLADGSIDLTADGGSPDYSFTWSTGSASEDLSGLTAGTYTVSVTDINSCVSGESITLIEPALLTSTVSPSTFPSGDNISCFGLTDGSIDLTVSGGSPIYSYAWNTGATSEDVSTLPAGDYDVTVTDINGCVVDESIILTETPPLSSMVVTSSFPSGDNISCYGFNDGSIDLTIDGGAPSYSFIWSSGETTEDLTSIFAGVYTVSITDLNGCEITETITLTEPPMLSSGTTVSVFPSGDNISCYGLNDGSIDLTIDGGSPGYSFLWSTGATTEDISTLVAGLYDVSVTDINGCVTNQTITLTEPIELISSVTSPTFPSGDHISCFGLNDGSIDLAVYGGSPVYSYSWSTGSVSEDLTDLSAGTYDVSITDINGCTTIESIVLTEPLELTSNVTSPLYPSGDNISCFGMNDGNIDLSISGGAPGYSYLWSTGSTAEDLSSLFAGTYEVTVTDINGCNTNENITLTEPPAFISTTSQTNITCFGLSDGSIDLSIVGGSPAYSILWNTGATTEDLSSLSSGTYDVVLTDVNGCTLADTIILTEPAMLTLSLVADSYASGDNISCHGLNDGSVDLTVTGGTTGYAFLWSNGSTEEDISMLTAGSYEISVTDSNGCEISETITLTEPPALLSTITAVPPSCYGLADGSGDLTVSGGSPIYSFSWLPGGETTEDLTGLLAGTYEVLITDVNDCSISDAFTITNPPNFTAGRDSSINICTETISNINLNDLLTSTATGDWDELTSSGQFNATTGVLNLIDLSAGVYEFIYTIPSYTPCTDEEAAITIIVDPTPAVLFIGDELTGCEPHTVNFDNLTLPSGANCEWNYGDGSNSLECGSTSHTFEYAGVYDVSLVVTTLEGCSSALTITDYIHVEKSAESYFTYSPDQVTIDNSEVEFQNESINATEYKWDFGDGYNSTQSDPNHVYPEVGNQSYWVTLIANNEANCPDTLSKLITVEDIIIFYVPNAFTPDGDQFNNEFKPVITAGVDVYDYHLRIFNRWGEVVFESYNLDFGWDGTYGDEGLVQDGVYVWQIDFGESMSDKRHEEIGHVTILR